MLDLTKKEKDLVTSAAAAANRLVELWGYLTEDRANRADLESARECVKKLNRFERLLEEKLGDAVKLEDKAEKPCSGKAPEADGPLKRNFRGIALVGFFKQFFLGRVD